VDSCVLTKCLRAVVFVKLKADVSYIHCLEHKGKEMTVQSLTCNPTAVLCSN